MCCFHGDWVLKNSLRKEVLTKGWSHFHSFWISKQKGQLKVEQQQTQMMEVLQKDVSYEDVLFFSLFPDFEVGCTVICLDFLVIFLSHCFF